MYTIYAGGVALAELDLEALYQRDRTALRVSVLYPCPSCGKTPDIRKDDGRWFLVGATCGCPVCDRVWALPDEDELADMDVRSHA